MFCVKCGTQINEGSRFCVSCGELVKTESALQPHQYHTDMQAPQDSQYGDNTRQASQGQYDDYIGSAPQGNQYSSGPPPALKKLSHKMIGIIVCAIAAVIVVVAIAGTNGSGYKKLIEQQIKAIETANADLLLSTIPPEIIEYFEEELGMWFGDSGYREFLQESLETNLRWWEDDYGKDFRISYEITSVSNPTKREQEDLEDNFLELGLSRGLQSIVKLEITVTIRGSKGSDELQFGNCYAYKLNGKWYLSGLFA